MIDSDNYNIPKKIKLSAVGLQLICDPNKLFKTFKHCHVCMTDALGHMIQRVRFNKIYRWWKDTRGAGSVIHWPIGKNLDSFPLLPIVNLVSTQLVSKNNDIACLLDLYKCQQIVNYSWLILAPQNTVVKPHQDMFGTASWNLLGFGIKRWSFWSPFSNKKFSAKPDMEFIQKPGDLVWIPEGWWHRVSYQSSSICISKNLIMRRSFSSIKRNCKKTDNVLSSLLDAIELLEKEKYNDH